MTKEEQYKKLEEFAIRIWDDETLDIGMYPKAFVGKYEKRTPYMEGWNAACRQVVININKLCEELGFAVFSDGLDGRDYINWKKKDAQTEKDSA